MRVQHVAKDGATRLLVRRAAAEGILDALRCGDSEIDADLAISGYGQQPLGEREAKRVEHGVEKAGNVPAVRDTVDDEPA